MKKRKPINRKNKWKSITKRKKERIKKRRIKKHNRQKISKKGKHRKNNQQYKSLIYRKYTQRSNIKMSSP